MVVALGGEGFMLETIHRVLTLRIPVYGMNCGSVGFLMNTFSEDDLPGRLARAGGCAVSAAHATVSAEWATRQDRHSTKYRCCVSCARPQDPCHGGWPRAAGGIDVRRHPDLHAGRIDGVCQRTGRSCRCRRALLPLTPISAFRPAALAARCRYAKVLFEVLEADKRPTAAVADFTEVATSYRSPWRAPLDQHSPAVRSDRVLSERIIAEQFTVGYGSRGCLIVSDSGIVQPAGAVAAVVG